MGYKQSCFNFIYHRGADETVIYNTFSKALVVLTDGELQQYNAMDFTDVSVETQLAENGILIENSFDELKFLKYLHYKTKFANDTLFLTIAPTLDCNFACPYCYENRRAGRMSHKVQDGIISFIRETVAHGVQNIDISWYGGEPLLYLDIMESLSRRIMALAQEHNCQLSMHVVTNGYLLTPRVVEMLDEVGVTKVQITLDGMRDNHNVRRPLRNGGGTFDKIMGNLALFADSPIAVLVRMNVDNQNYKDYKILKEAVAQLGNDNLAVYASPVEDLNKDTINEVSDFMTKDEFGAFAIEACNEGVLSPEDFDVMDNRCCFCTAETENCYVVDELGNFYKCWDEVGREEYRCFNILDPDNINYTNIAKYLSDDPFSDEQCRDCVFLPLCFGGCRFQKAHLDKSVCGFTAASLTEYIEAAFLSGREVKPDEGSSASEVHP